MARKFYARRYAQAVFAIAQEQQALDAWQADLEKISGLLQDGELAALLQNPKVPFEAKAGLLTEQLEDVNPLALNLVYLLLSRGGLALAADIAAEYRQLLDSYRGIEPAEVATAVPLTDEDKKQLAGQLGAITGKEVVIKAVVDPALLGGITARIGGKLLDGSTRSRLKALKRALAQGGG